MLKKGDFFWKGGKKKAQVTVFILVAILLVVGILIYFFLISPSLEVREGTRLDFDSCVSDVVENNIKLLGLQGGFVEPEFSYLYENNEVGYLCYTNLYYSLCSVQKPFLKNHFEENLEAISRGEINECYENSVLNLQEEGYEVVAGKVDFEVAIEPGVVKVDVKAPTSVEKDVGQNFENFDVSVKSNLYDVLMVSTSILQYEAKYGDADVSNFMIFYPDLKVQKIKRSDGTTIYMVEDKIDETKFQFASRSLAWPPGYIYE